MNKYNLEKLKEKLERCKNILIKEINPDDVDNIEDIKISKKKCREERILDFIATTKNPYAFKVNGTLVKISFSNNNRSAKDCINKVIKSLYK